MTSHPRLAWTRLGELLIRRRIELDPRYRNRRAFTAERAVEYRIVNDIELGNRTNYESATIAALEAAYAIPAGSIGRILAGGEIEIPAATPPPPGPAPREDEEIPGVASMLATPGIGPYLAALDAEREQPGWEPANADELRIWLDPRMNDRTRRALVAFRRLVWDQAVRSRDSNASLWRSKCASL
jgi:hypothetical protein